MRIGELAQAAGVTTRTVRHYHRVQLLPEPPRDAAGHRTYTRADLDRLLQVTRLRKEGHTIAEIGDLLTRPQGSWPASLDADVSSVDAEIARLVRVRDYLRRSARNE